MPEAEGSSRTTPSSVRRSAPAGRRRKNRRIRAFFMATIVPWASKGAIYFGPGFRQGRDPPPLPPGPALDGPGFPTGARTEAASPGLGNPRSAASW